MRRLIWVPIIHTTADMGTMEPELRALYEEKTGTQWESHKTAVEEMWDLITDKIEQLDLDYSRVRLYQDGLPECGQELEIARDIAESGSRNHQLLLQFVDRGATLMGTESRDLLLEEYQTLQETLETLKSGEAENAPPDRRKQSLELLRKRDRHIAERIGETLEPGETGIVFLGLLHSIKDLFPSDVEVITLGRVEPDDGGSG